MNILIVGVSGFIGRHLYHVLCQHGFHLTGCSRHEVPAINWQFFDFNQTPEQWGEQLQNVDIVINAAGIYQQSDSQRFSQIHDIGPKKLFEACRKHKVKVIQLSAIGAEKENPVTAFLQSKRSADQYLLAGDIANVVLYPGIVLGERGRSTRQLSVLADLPCIPLVFGRGTALPLISIYQLTEYIVGIINNWPNKKQASVLVAQAETMEQLLSNLRRWMNLTRGCFVSIPKQILSFVFYLFPGLSIGVFNKQSIDMLSTYSNQVYTSIVNETASASLLKYKVSVSFKKDTSLTMLFYINLITLGFIWIVSGLSSLINIEQSRELITLVGFKGLLGDSFIFTAAIGDILLGLLLWYPALRRWVIYVQIAVMVIYSIIISIFIPAFWLHPFAPIIKNLAMLVLALYLLVEEKE